MNPFLRLPHRCLDMIGFTITAVILFYIFRRPKTPPTARRCLKPEQCSLKPAQHQPQLGVRRQRPRGVVITGNLLPVLDYLRKINKNMSGEYVELANSYHHSNATEKILIDLPNIEITRVCVVHNNYLRGMYELKKLEYISRYGQVQELNLFHSTSARNVNSILKDNLDWRKVIRNKFGSGVSFSDDADYADFHSNRKNGRSRAFIIASVLVAEKTRGNAMMTIPPWDYDTTCSSNGKVYVKYCDNEFMIKYVVYYNAPK